MDLPVLQMILARMVLWATGLLGEMALVVKPYKEVMTRVLAVMAKQLVRRKVQTLEPATNCLSVVMLWLVGHNKEHLLRPVLEEAVALVLGPSVCKDILSLALSLAIDPAVNAFKPRHCDALASLAGTLRGDGAADALNAMLLDATTDTRAPSPDADAAGETVTASRLLWENRMLSSFCVAVSGSASVFADLQTAAAGALDAVRLVVREYHDATSELEKTWRTYQSAWGDASVSPATLRARFLESFPKYKEDPRLTGCWHAAPVAAPAPAVSAPSVAAQLPLENQENGIEWPSDED
ncbi:hypothetical protein I4F81_005249 [Pyropia yezoensis]|uniref:Uncharacterized protein n=1 Tax=Pyropia yezoensis TaxID=2788 RepID=A0ACC3BXA9_PYRYE|nr:hypothetical protein I4F81_005249 [Neopyropia yezoensis]